MVKLLMERFYTQVVQNILEHSKITNNMAKELLFIRMEPNITVNGKKEKSSKITNNKAIGGF